MVISVWCIRPSPSVRQQGWGGFFSISFNGYALVVLAAYLPFFSQKGGLTHANPGIPCPVPIPELKQQGHKRALRKMPEAKDNGRCH